MTLTYRRLVPQIISYANRQKEDVAFTTAIPCFVNQAQERIWLEAKDLGFETLTTLGRFQDNNPIIAKPANWNKTVSFSITVNPNDGSSNFLFSLLEMRTYEYCVSIWPNIRKSGGIDNPPLYYCDREFAVEGNSDPNYASNNNLVNTPYSAWYVAPTPNKDIGYQVTYLASVQNIDDTNQTNILTAKFPQLLFYASMCEAFSWTGEPERLQVFEGLYKQSLTSVNKETEERHVDRTSKIGID